MGYIFHMSPEVEKLSEDERLKITDLSLVAFSLAIQIDGKPKALILQPGDCEPEWGWDNEILFVCLDISAPVIASYVRHSDGAVHIFISLASEEGAIFL